MKKKRMGIKAIIIFILVVIALFLSLVGFLTDFLWFKELGYVSVFFTKLFTQLKIGIPVFLIITFLSYIYLKFLKRGYFKKIQSQEATNHKRLNLISWGLALVFGALVTYISISTLWFEILELTNATDFNLSDPLFHMDISFYVFKLAFIEKLNQLLIGVIIAFAALTLVYYTVLLSLRTPQIFEETEPDDERFDGTSPGQGNFDNVSDIFGKFTEAFTGKRPAARPPKKRKQFDDQNFMHLLSIAQKQLIVVGALFFLMVGVHFFLKQYDLLYSTTGVVRGAGFTDVNVTLWVYRIIMGLSVVAAVAFGLSIVRKKFKFVVIVPILMVVVGILGAGAGGLVQNFIVSPDEISKESKYLKENIAYTQRAYGLDQVSGKPFSANNNLTGQDIKNNEATLSNIRINDYEPTQKFYNNTQNIRTYYTFPDVDVDRYNLNGKYTQTFLSARELDESKISDTWLNRHIKYTHGYGITLSRVDQITDSGQPDMLIDSIPPESRVKEIAIKRPEIYFGQETNDYILVDTDEQEFDYPDGDSNKYTTYQGTAGIKMNLLNKTLFSIREKSLKMLVSDNLTSDSRIIINRNIVDRVKTIMPYLDYDKDPYIVTAEGKLYWMLDAYTTSSRYPYSEAYEGMGGTNYIRNSVKVVIDAYNGTTNYYLVNDQDPVANTYKKIYPKLFKDMSQMPQALKSHIRYPSTLLNIQANVYKRYHMNDVKVFYQNEDFWDIAKETYGTQTTDMRPNYYVMKLPGEKTAEFVNTIPYTPKDKRNMMGLLIARNDGTDYGKLMLYKLPKSKIVYGPEQIEAQIDQNTDISRDFSLWDSAGSNYSRGNMFVVPIEDSLLYVEPIYLEATNSSIPEVKRVIVAYNGKIAYKSALAEALNELFGAGSAQETPSASTGTDQSPPAKTDRDSLIQKAQQAFNNAKKAQESGDWAGYGKYQKQLQQYLNQLAATKK